MVAYYILGGFFLCFSLIAIKERIERANQKEDKVIELLIFISLCGGFLSFISFIIGFCKGLTNG